MYDKSFVPIDGQSFSSHQDWVNRASRVLTSHPQYNNTAHEGPTKGWRGYHFTTMCFDQSGKRCLNGKDFQDSMEAGDYPIWWVWPDQISNLIMEQETKNAE